MTDRLRELMADASAQEARRFDSEHRGDDTGLYERAIAPRRAARRAIEAGAGLLALVLVLVVGGAIADGAGAWRGSEPATTPELTAPVVPRADWRVDGLGWKPNASAAHVSEVWDVGDADACHELPGTVPGAEPEPGAIGGFVSDGVSIGLYHGTFPSHEEAQAYSAQLASRAEGCAAVFAAQGFDASYAEIGLVAVRGSAWRLDVAPADGSTEPWRLWTQVSGAQVLVVIAEPGRRDSVTPIVVDWFNGGARPDDE